MDTYGGGLGVMWVAIFETAVLMWIYGVSRFADDLTFMLKYKVNIFWKFCWSITPIILTAIFVIACFHWTVPAYGASPDSEQWPVDTVFYPDWIHYVGWFLTILVAAQIPVAAVVMMVYFGVKGKCLAVFQPSEDWGPGDKEARQEWIAYKYNKAMTCKRHPYATYDNYGMNYPIGYYAGAGTYHM